VDLRNERELANTREKLRRSEVLYEADERETGGDEELREAEMESLKRLINQFKEEIARYETRTAATGGLSASAERGGGAGVPAAAEGR